MIEPKAAPDEITRKFYGSAAPAQEKNLKTGSIPAAAAIKSFIELPDGQLVDEEIVEELTETIKATSEVLAVARQILEV